MKTVTTITSRVVKLSEIPENITAGHWVETYPKDRFIFAQVNLDKEDKKPDLVSDWFDKNYPELFEEDSFFIEIDR